MLRRRWHALPAGPILAGAILAALLGAQPPAVEATGTQKIKRRNIEKATAKSRPMSKALEKRVDLAVERGLAWI